MTRKTKKKIFSRLLYSLESRQKSQKLQTGFPRHWEEFLKIFNAVRITTERALMIYHSTQSDDYLWYLILRVKQKEKTKLLLNVFSGIWSVIGYITEKLTLPKLFLVYGCCTVQHTS